MKSVVAPLVLAIVLALAGAVFWLAGNTERRLSDIHSQLATLQYSAVTADSDDAEQNLGLAKRVPQVGAAAAADLRDVRTTADYWRGGYSAIAPQGRVLAAGSTGDSSGAATESDPRVLLRAANAAFRGSQMDTDRAGALRKMDAVVKTYADVVRSSPANMDAAYNYEYAIRVRDVMNKTKSAPPAKSARANPSTDLNKAASGGDLPAGPTLHGRPGGPPPASDMSQFKIVIPKRGDERKENPEAGKGGTKVRRG
jgi:hypothetical protein